MHRSTPFIAVVLLLLAAAGPAQAAFSGKNGDIVFRSNRTGNADIYTMHADGSNRVNLTRSPAEDVDPRWSPDGSRIAFASDRTGIFQIYTMNADGTGVTQLTSFAAHNRRPSWTADGRILFQSDRDDLGQIRDVFVMNADGSGVRNLTQSASDDAFAAAAPRGDRVVFTSNGSGDDSLYILSLNQPVATPHRITSGGEDIEANWSPSGNALVFARFDSSFDSSEIYSAHADGTGLTQLTHTPDRIESEPAWSPDGTKIVFHACGGSGESQRCANYEMNPDGSDDVEVSLRPTAPFVDDFSSTPLDDFWTTSIVGDGTSVRQANGRLEISLPAGGLPDPSSGYANPGVFSVCNLRGDFDIQVDYDLLTQPFPDFVNPLFNEGNFVDGQWMSADGIFLSKWGISGNFDGMPFDGFVPNVPPQGSMRLTRQASTLTAAYNVDGTWQTLETRNDLVADESDVALSLFSNALQQQSDVSVAFDNFRVDSGTISCPAWWGDEAPDWQALAGRAN